MYHIQSLFIFRNLIFISGCLMLMIFLFFNQKTVDERSPQQSNLATEVNWKCDVMSLLTTIKPLPKNTAQKYRSNTNNKVNRSTIPNLSVITAKHLIVDDNLRYIYCAVPKSGSTQWKTLLYAIQIVLNETIYSGLARDNVQKRENYTVDHILKAIAAKYGEFRSQTPIFYPHNISTLRYVYDIIDNGSLEDLRNLEQKFRQYHKFMFVWDPLDRVLSAYRDKFGTGANEYFSDRFVKYIEEAVMDAQRERNTFLRNCLSRSDNQNSTDHVPSFVDFVEFLIDSNTRASNFLKNEHWLPIVDLCDPCLIKYDTIVKMEEKSKYGLHLFQKLFNNFYPIKTNLSFDVTTGFYDLFRYNSTTKTILPKYLKDLTLSQLRNLTGLYRNDYFLFNYSMWTDVKTSLS